MNQAAVNASYREAASTLAPQAVSEYLALSPWRLERRDSIREIWQLNRPDGSLVGRLMLPLATDYSDFKDRFYDALLALGKINDWDADQLQEQILSTKADLFFIRLDQATADGTIPFTQAKTTLAAIYDMVRASAEDVAQISPSRQVHPAAAVTSFLNNDVRLAHTKRGSFIFTVAARFNHTQSPNEKLPNAPAPSNPGSPAEAVFARRVMQTLASNLEIARDIADPQANRFNFDITYTDVASYPEILQSLEVISKPEGLRAVEFSFQWAASAPRPEVGIEPILISHSKLPRLTQARAALTMDTQPGVGAQPGAYIPLEETSERQTLIGPVVSLTRDRGGVKPGAKIVIRADIGHGNRKNVHLRLSGRDHHQLAIQAYSAQIPVRVSGDLVFTSRRWRLTGNVELDASFMQSRLSDK